MRPLVLTAGLAALFVAPRVLAVTYQVGPDKPYRQITELESVLEPGDVVEVDGDATYSGDIHIRAESSGLPDQPVVLRGVRKNGKRPVIEGGTEFGIVLNASFFLFEGFEVTGAANFCVVHKGDQVSIRDVLVHDCPNHGILGTDFESGSLTMEFVEVYGCGSGLYEHQVYVASDESMYPGSVFRLQHSYIHDGNGGNNVKSRFERNEIYANWIEAPVYHVLDLIGPDGQDPDLAREDSDIVGNVLIQTTEWSVLRMGGDGTGDTSGRYRFAYNTVVLSPDSYPVFRPEYAIESVAIHDNVFFAPSGGDPVFWEDDDAYWVSGSRRVAAERNWVQAGLVAPDFFTSTITGPDPGFEDFASGLLVPLEGSPLVDAGMPGSGPAGYEVPGLLAMPVFAPPARSVLTEPVARPDDGTPDIGAYEHGTQVVPGPTTASSGDPAGGADGGQDDPGELEGKACACEVAGARRGLGGLTGLAVAAAALGWRRRRARNVS